MQNTVLSQVGLNSKYDFSLLLASALAIIAAIAALAMAFYPAPSSFGGLPSMVAVLGLILVLSICVRLFERDRAANKALDALRAASAKQKDRLIVLAAIDQASQNAAKAAPWEFDPYSMRFRCSAIFVEQYGGTAEYWSRMGRFVDGISGKKKLWFNELLELPADELKSTEFEFRDFYGNNRWVKVSASMVSIDRRTLIVGSFCDQSPMIKQQQRFKQRFLEVQRAQSEVEKFSQAMSRDLLSPLHTVNALLDSAVVELEGGNQHQALQLLHRIASRNDRMLNLINSLRGYFAQNQSATLVDSAPVKLVDLVQKISTECCPSGGRLAEIHCNVPMLQINRFAVEDALRCIIENAYKFGSDKVQVRIEAKLNGRCLQLAISDDGPGVAAESSERIFEPFYRLGSDDQASGSGLGLALVRRLCASHQARVWLDPHYKHGARFYLIWPLSGEDTSPGAVEDDRLDVEAPAP